MTEFWQQVREYFGRVIRCGTAKDDLTLAEAYVNCLCNTEHTSTSELAELAEPFGASCETTNAGTRLSDGSSDRRDTYS